MMEFFSPNERCYVPWLICYWFATGAAAVLLPIAPGQNDMDRKRACL